MAFRKSGSPWRWTGTRPCRSDAISAASLSKVRGIGRAMVAIVRTQSRRCAAARTDRPVPSDAEGGHKAGRRATILAGVEQCAGLRPSNPSA